MGKTVNRKNIFTEIQEKNNKIAGEVGMKALVPT